VSAVYDATWYDLVMVEADSPAMLPLEESPWLSTYTEVAKMIDPHEEVVDLGCGTGRFIELLYRREHYARVTGVDWSVTALAEAQAYVNVPLVKLEEDGPPIEIPRPNWELCDLDDWRPDGLRSGNTVYVCSEVLEHLEDDLGLVRRVPPGHRLILTVPNFHSESHIRIFQNVSDVWERYDRLLHIRRWVMVGSERQGIHIAETRRRSDSW
jgi:trans-aconitate methyltransferase